MSLDGLKFTHHKSGSTKDKAINQAQRNLSAETALPKKSTDEMLPNWLFCPNKDQIASFLQLQIFTGNSVRRMLPFCID